jgi:hypothetical protein
MPVIGPTSGRQRVPSLILAPLAIMAGLLVAWIDSGPRWDDAGVTAGMIFLTAALFGALRPSKAPLWALCVGAWVPFFGIVLHGNFGTLLALAVAFLGAFAGALARRTLAPPRSR